MKSVTSSAAGAMLIAAILFSFGVSSTSAGPAAYGVCQAGCATVVVACYAAGGAVFGTVTAGLGIPAAILGCNTAFGTCQAACAAVLILPTP